MQALEGIVVLDLARRFPGAFSTMFLGDFGATVIKVDAPDAAGLVVPGVDCTGDRFAAMFTLDRNKQSVSINLKTEEGREVFRRLAKTADVVLEGFRPGVMDRLGVGYRQLSELNPRLIYCATSGYGQEGPYRDLPGHDWNYVSVSGVQSLIGVKDGPPVPTSNIIGDLAGAGMHAAVGILIALMARERTGKGQFVDVAFLDSAMSLLTTEATFYFVSGVVPKRGYTQTTGATAHGNFYRCKDGEYVTVLTVEPHFWENLCRALGREDFIPHQHSGPSKQDEMFAAFSEIFLTRTRDEWFEYFKDKNTCFSPVLNVDETFDDPQVRARQMLVEIDDPKVGKVRQVGIPIKLSDTPGSIRRLGVEIGTDNDEVLAGLGYGVEEVARLRAARAIG